MNAYSELYIDEAMLNMGEMAHYAVADVGMEGETFLHILIVSGLADEWSHGSPRCLVGRSGTELVEEMCSRCGYGPLPEPASDFSRDSSYWAGWILAYYQWRSGRDLRDILRTLGWADLMALYPAAHTVSENQAYEMIGARIQSKSRVSRLQMYRRAMGLTQMELAEESGVNLRTIQEYESGRKKLSKAASAKVIRLAGVLETRPEDLVE